MLEKPPPTLWGAGGPSRRLANCWRPSDDFGRLNADDRRATPGPAALLGERSLYTEKRAISRQFGWRAQNLKTPSSLVCPTPDGFPRMDHGPILSLGLGASFWFRRFDKIEQDYLFPMVGVALGGPGRSPRRLRRRSRRGPGGAPGPAPPDPASAARSSPYTPAAMGGVGRSLSLACGLFAFPPPQNGLG